MDQANRDLRQELADTTTKLSTMTQENKSLQELRDALRGELSESNEKLKLLEKNLEAVLKTKDTAMREANKEIKDLKADLRAEKKERKQLATELRQAKAQKPRRYVIDKINDRTVATLLYEGEELPEKEEEYALT